MKLAIILLASAQLLLMVSSQDNLETHCKNKFKTVHNVEQMVELAKELGNYRSGLAEHKAMKKLERCVDEYDSIKELAELLQYKGDVCHPDHVANMLRYHRNYVLGSQNSGVQRILKKNKRMTRFFFRRYGLHVALVCRQNAMENLREVSKEFTIEDWHHVMPWRKNSSHSEPSVEINNKLTSSNDDIEESAKKLVEFISTFDVLSRVLNIGTTEFSSSPQTTMSQSEREMNEDMGIRIENEIKVRSMINTCDKFAVYYEGQVLSVVRLANVGYRWYGHKLNENNEASDEDRRLLADWIKLSQICFSLRKYKETLRMEDRPLVYHDFKNNHFATNQELTSNEIIIANAMSKFDFEKSELARKLFRSEGHLVGLLAKRFTNSRRVGAFLERYQRQLEIESGDRPSQYRSTGVPIETIEKTAGGFILLMIIVFVLIVVLGKTGVIG